MRKIIVIEFMSLDGVMQALGGPEEDLSGDFKLGGWLAPYTDEVSAGIMQKQMEPADLLLGRKTFEIFAAYWPAHAAYWPGINEVTKFVLSTTVRQSVWINCIFLDHIESIKKLKNSEGSDIKVWGSSQLVQLLLEHDLVDELWLKIYPLTLGNGKKLFREGTMPAAFTLTESIITPAGVIIASYKRAGEVKTGTMGG
ncbi:MAG: dihydrofolate reductase family protein [Bacteroidota bacterium]|nr:dihydrofolate reductase family protein [Bacteroidota bacterium]